MPIKTNENEPLTESTLFIMLSIAVERKYGYAIMKDVKMLSENRIELSTGTLYGALKRLLELDWIERVDDPDTNGNRERKAYVLTTRGRRVLKAEIERLEKLLEIARPKIIKENA